MTAWTSRAMAVIGANSPVPKEPPIAIQQTHNPQSIEKTLTIWPRSGRPGRSPGSIPIGCFMAMLRGREWPDQTNPRRCRLQEKSGSRTPVQPPPPPCYPARMNSQTDSGSRALHEQWLLALTAIPTAAGRERRVVEWIHEWVSERPDLALSADRFGNLTIEHVRGLVGQRASVLHHRPPRPSGLRRRGDRRQHAAPQLPRRRARSVLRQSPAHRALHRG